MSGKYKHYDRCADDSDDLKCWTNGCSAPLFRGGEKSVYWNQTSFSGDDDKFYWSSNPIGNKGHQPKPGTASVPVSSLTGKQTVHQDGDIYRLITHHARCERSNAPNDECFHLHCMTGEGEMLWYWPNKTVISLTEAKEFQRREVEKALDRDRFYSPFQEFEEAQKRARERADQRHDQVTRELDEFTQKAVASPLDDHRQMQEQVVSGNYFKMQPPYVYAPEGYSYDIKSNAKAAANLIRERYKSGEWKTFPSYTLTANPQTQTQKEAPDMATDTRPSAWDNLYEGLKPYRDVHSQTITLTESRLRLLLDEFEADKARDWADAREQAKFRAARRKEALAAAREVSDNGDQVVKYARQFELYLDPENDFDGEGNLVTESDEDTTPDSTPDKS